MTLQKLLYRYTAKLPCRLIRNEDDSPYLERYYIGKCFGVTFYLHRFVSSNAEKHLHNHPWKWARAVVLSGSYGEEVALDLCPAATPPGGSGCITTARKIRWYNKINGNHFHRIVSPSPGTWTLFFHGEREQIKNGDKHVDKGWGFLENYYGVGVHNVTLFRPFPANFPGWWETAPVGAESAREPWT